MTQWLQQKKPVVAQLSEQHASNQATARNNLLMIFRCVQYLARQGLALRGHDLHEGNLQQLLCMCAKSDDSLDAWLKRHQDYTSWIIQNEMLSVMSNAIIRAICGDMKKVEPAQTAIFAVIADGTRDVNGQEQESICVRYVTDDLFPNEAFLGFYAAESTTGATLRKIVLDVLCRLQLPTENLRGQTFDGAANMSGAYNGAQALIREVQPLAIFVHCSAHCINLVTEAACTASQFIRDAIDTVHELGVLSKQSGKFQTLLASVAAKQHEKVLTVRPLCPTRWTVRSSAISKAVQQYESIIDALEEMSANTGNVGSRASGLLTNFGKGSTFLGLLIALEITEQLENLNRALQGRQTTVSGTLQAVASVTEYLTTMRSDSAFRSFFSKAEKAQEDMDLDVIAAPRKRRPPRRYSGPAEPYQTDSVMEFYKHEYFKVIDTAVVQLDDRFNQDGLKVYEQLEKCLILGEVTDACSKYPEVDKSKLQTQLAMFRQQFEYSTTQEAQQILRSAAPEVRLLFSQVETLLRILLVIPATSCEAERSFSGLRRLKTWLRSTMSQQRTNAVAVCHVHQKYLDCLDTRELVNDFIGNNERRVHLFGKF